MFVVMIYMRIIVDDLTKDCSAHCRTLLHCTCILNSLKVVTSTITPILTEK